MKLGINLWTVYGWEPPEPVSDEVLQALADMGSQGVELVVDEANNPAEMWLERQPTLSALLNELSLEVPSVATALFWRYNLASQDEGLRQRGLETVRAGCQVAEAFGAGVFLVVAGIQETHTEYERSYERAVASLRVAGDYAADLGVILGVENVPSNFLCSPGEYARFIADVDHPAVRAYLDFGNGASIGRGYPENWITAVWGNTAMIHAKDHDRGFNAFVCCGQGDLQWDAIFQALREIEYEGYLLVETPPLGGRGQPSRAAGLQAAQSSLSWLSRYTTKSE
jgi:L-ribulose-5-phosphate 3-epimerase